jgi:UDP-glucose:(heptosyl)LPS alpha-1,3-glucosyltransferase
MKLAIIRQSYRPDGGAEKIIVRLIDGLRCYSDLHVSIIAKGWKEVLISEKFSIIPIQFKGWFRHGRVKNFIFSVRKVLQEKKFDLIQSHERVPGCQIYRAGDGVHAEWLNIKAARENIWSRLLISFSPFHRLMLQLEYDLFHHPNLKKVICISQHGKRDILRHYPSINSDKLVCIYNGIDLYKYSPVPESAKLEVRSRLAIHPKKPVAIFVGSGFVRKGLGDLLEALSLTTEWELLVVGKDKRQKSFMKKAQKLGIANRIHFLGVQTHMQDLYATADLLVHPAWYEPFGNVVLEAMAMGRGVLVSSDCGASELVNEGINGHVFASGNVKQLASLLDTCKDRVCLESMGNHARVTAEQYPISRMVDELVSVYQLLLAGKS